MHRVTAAVGACVLVAVTAACGGSSSHATAGPAAPDSSGSPTAIGGPASTGPSAGASPAATASRQPGAVGSPTAGGSPRVVASGPGSKPPGSPSGFTRAGTYTYDVSGTATTPLGTQKLGGTSTLAEDPPAGSRQHSVQTTSQGSQEQTLDVRSSGLYVVTLKIHQQGFDEEFTPIGTALFFPADYAVGRAWSWSARSTDGKYRVDVSSRIAGTSAVTVQGRSLRCLVVDSTLHITGSGFDVTDKQRDWVSTTYALILKEHAVTSGTAEGFAISSDVTRTIRSTTPS